MKATSRETVIDDPLGFFLVENQKAEQAKKTEEEAKKKREAAASKQSAIGGAILDFGERLSTRVAAAIAPTPTGGFVTGAPTDTRSPEKRQGEAPNLTAMTSGSSAEPMARVASPRGARARGGAIAGTSRLDASVNEAIQQNRTEEFAPVPTKESYNASLNEAVDLVRYAKEEVSEDVSNFFVDDWTNGPMPSEGDNFLFLKDVKLHCRDTTASVAGVLRVSPYQLKFDPADLNAAKSISGTFPSGILRIPLSCVAEVEAEKQTKGKPELGLGMEITSKDHRLIRFSFQSVNECRKAAKLLDQLVYATSYHMLFAMNYPSSTEAKALKIPEKVCGWNLYNDTEDYKRMGLPSATLQISKLNKEFKLCSTYPPNLVLPSSKDLSDAEVQAVALFRSRERIPALSWKHPFGEQTIWRCAQPMAGVNSRGLEDEKFLEVILNANKKAKPRQLVIFDARPWKNAVANKSQGRGYENVKTYKKVDLRFMNIENIHVVRHAHKALVKACQKQITTQEKDSFLSAAASSNWLVHISEILKGTLDMVVCVDRFKGSLVCHCSDGWDRTSQLTSLAMLCLDPYYRTTKGFFILIEKEWLSFGHKFDERTGHGARAPSDQRAPVFMQWCDCVFQLIEQFPYNFQFNSQLLVTMLSHLHSCRFGTFLFDAPAEREKADLKTKSFSLWTYLLCSPAARAGVFSNPLYSAKTATAIVQNYVGSGQFQDGRGVILYPCWSQKKLTLWTDYFLRWNTTEARGFENGNPGVATAVLTSNVALLEEHIRCLSRELAKAKARIRELEGKVGEGDGDTEQSIVVTRESLEPTLQQAAEAEEEEIEEIEENQDSRDLDARDLQSLTSAAFDEAMQPGSCDPEASLSESRETLAGSVQRRDSMADDDFEAERARWDE